MVKDYLSEPEEKHHCTIDKFDFTGGSYYTHSKISCAVCGAKKEIHLGK